MLKLPPGYQRASRNPMLARGDLGVLVTVQDNAAVPGDPSDRLFAIQRSLRDRTDGTVEFEPIERRGARGFIARGVSGKNALRSITVVWSGGITTVTVIARKDATEADRIVESVEVDATAKADPLEVLGLELSLGGRFEAASLGSSVIIVPRGATFPLPHTAPKLALLAVPHARRKPPDARAIEQLLAHAFDDAHPDFTRAERSTVTVDGVEASEAIVPGQSQSEPITLYGLVVPDDHDTLLLFGSVGGTGSDQRVGELRRLARSLHRKPGIVGDVAR